MADASLLEDFPNPHPDRNYLITHTAHEFTSLCPVTAQPDFGTLEFEYVADQRCIELRSLKQYLQSFRSDGIFYEDVTNRILNDIFVKCQPRWLQVTSRWSVRGGIDTVIVAERGDFSAVPPSKRPSRWDVPNQDNQPDR